MSSEADARSGAALDEKRLHLFRNITPLHWVLTVPSTKDPATGGWTGGDLDAMGDGRGMGIAGHCIFIGHENGLGQKHGINIFRIPPDAVKNQPVQVGEIAAMSQGDQGFDDRELRSLLYTASDGRDRQIPGPQRRDTIHRQRSRLRHRPGQLARCGPPAASTIFGPDSRMNSICGMTRQIRIGFWCT